MVLWLEELIVLLPVTLCLLRQAAGFPTALRLYQKFSGISKFLRFCQAVKIAPNFFRRPHHEWLAFDEVLKLQRCQI